MVKSARGRWGVLGALCLALSLGCAGKSRAEYGGEGDAGDAGETGDTGGVSGSAGLGGASGSASTGGQSLGGVAGTSAGSAGSSGMAGAGGSAGMGVPPRPPLTCDEGDPVALPPDETAERLARLFFRAPASEELLASAATDGLRTSGAVGCFARGMIDDVASVAGISDFFDGWLDLGKRAVPPQDPALVPEFSPALLARAKEASLWFAADVVRTGGTLTRLLLDDVAPMDADLAPLYGFIGVGSDFEMIDTGAERAGILTHVYFLMNRATRAHGSPTQRGLGLSLMLGCLPFALPPSDFVDSVPATFEGTTRSWYETTLSADTCAGCHAYLTLAGYAFEHFDVLGRYRTVEAGEVIDSQAVLYAFGDNGIAVADHLEAMAVLAGHSVTRRCMAEHWLAYALASLAGERAYAVPAPTLDETALEHVILRASFEPDFDLREMLVAGVETAPFLMAR